MRRISPYCQSKTPANAHSPVKIIQCSRGARSGTPEASRSDDMVVTLMFRPPGCGNDEAAYRRSELHASQNDRGWWSSSLMELTFFRHSEFGVPRTQRSA